MAAVDAEEEITSINVTPLVDVVLVLLIILMVTSSALLSQSIPMDLPKAATGDTIPSVVRIALDQRGATYWEGTAISEREIKARAAAAYADNRDVRVVLSADRKLAHGRVIHVMDVLRSADITKIAIQVEAPKEAQQVAAQQRDAQREKR